MQTTGRGRQIRRLLATLAATAALSSGLLVPATPASADISLGLSTDGSLLNLNGMLDGMLGDGTMYGWGMNGATPISTTQVGKVIGAASPAAAGLDGSGVGVALIDTGVVPVPGLPATTVVNGPDLSFESQAPGLRYLDTYGHGTHMAGIIVGNDPSTGFRGIAPGAKLTSVKVGTAQGMVDVSQVIAAVDWVVAHRNDDPLNPIRVINLSYGTDSSQGPLSDPLSYAVENAWRAGIVVVVAGGNGGYERSRLDNPAADRYVLAVGSAATGSTTMTDDDYMSTFNNDSTGRSVDVLAPGESIISLRDPGSYIDENYPKGRVTDRTFKGSGTSQATAVASGAVALLLQKRPGLRPDQVKTLLKSTATPVDVAGEINLAAALAKATPTSTQTWTQGTGTGSLDKARGTHRLLLGTLALVGESDIFGPFNSTQWAAASAAGTAWVGGTWMGHPMAGDGWTGTSWASQTWASTTWPPGYWGSVWAGGDWSSHTWSGTYWSGTYWSGTYWSSDTW